MWFSSPKGKRIWVQKAQYNDFVESGFENYALMSWITIIMDPDDNKVKIEWIYPKKIVIGTIQGDQFLYIFLEFDYKHSFYCYSIFLSILRSLSLRVFFLFYTIFLLLSLCSMCRLDCLC